MQSSRDSLDRQAAHAVFEVAWQGTAPDGEPPQWRQIENLVASSLPATRKVGDHWEYQRDSVERVAQVHAQSAGLWRVMHATERGPWKGIWFLHRRYSENGVVVLVNTALAAELTKRSNVPRRSLQRFLNDGTITNSRIGNTYFVPLKGLEAYLKALRLSAPGVSEQDDRLWLRVFSNSGIGCQALRGVVRCQLRTKPAQLQGRVDPAKQMIARNHVFEIEFIKKTVLPTQRLAHHHADPLAPSSQARNHEPRAEPRLLQKPRPGNEIRAMSPVRPPLIADLRAGDIVD